MNVEHLHSSFFGPPLNVHIHRARNGRFVPFNRQTRNIRASSFSIFNQNQKRNKRVEFGQFGRGYVKFPMKKSMATWDHFRISSANGPSSKSSSLVTYLAPLWKEGLLIVRCSVLFAVLSASIMLVLYSQRQAKKFVEARLLPSVCSMLSQYLQRELDFGKVQGISPLGITLQSCSIGPHHEEFSCGQFPRMKLRFRPFASLRRGKIVIDAVLIRPNILIAQKEDFSWLGIPPSSDGHIKRHSSSEDGIDYRTRTRRLAREKASDIWYDRRSDAARKAAELGYFVPQESSDLLSTAESVDDPFMPLQSAGASSLFSMDDGKLWKDHHSVDMGMEYVLKHVELEKSFGINVPTKGFRFWPKIVPNPRNGKFKWEGHRKMLEQDTVACKRRNLECSAAAALAYFKGLNNGGASADPAEGSLSNGGSSAAICSKIDIPSSSNKGLENFDKNINFGKASDGENFLEENLRSGAEQCGKMDAIGSPFSTKDNEDEGNCIDMQHRHALQDSFNSKNPHKFNSASDPMTRIKHELNRLMTPIQLSWVSHVFAKDSLLRTGHLDAFEQMGQHEQMQISETHDCSEDIPDYSAERILGTSCSGSECHTSKLQDGLPNKTKRDAKVWDYVGFHPSNPKLILQYLYDLSGKVANHLVGQVQKLKSYLIVRAELISSEFIEGMDLFHTNRRKMLPITLDSIYFTDGTLMLLAYGDQEPREMDGVNGHVKFQNHYSRVHVQLSGNCKEWRSDGAVRDGGLLSADVFVDIVDQKWHANLKAKNLFAPLFERIIELPITWSKGSASGEVHICMSDGEIFPNIYGQLDVHDLSFCILEAPSCFSDITATLCFRGQRIFLHNASGRFGDVPLEASGDFGINPEDGEFHLMCQVPSVEVNMLMRTLKMKPLLFSLAGSVTAVFNCQGPLDAPLFVGSGIISRKTPHLASGFPPSPASEAVNKNREAGAVAAFDHIPFSHVSANFTFNTDNCVADLYGMRATLVDGGEIRGAGNAWICPEGEVDDSAMDLNLSGNCIFERVVSHYLPNVSLMPLKIGELNGEAKLSGPLLKPRFDIRWGAPRALDSFSQARGDIIISHDYITVNSSSVAFDLYMKVQTSYLQDIPEITIGSEYPKMAPLIIDGLDADLRLRGFDFSSIIFSNSFDAPKPIHLKASGKMKFVGKVVKLDSVLDGSIIEGGKNLSTLTVKNLVGEVSLSGVKLNQLMVAPQLTGSLSFSRERVKLDAAGRPDESMSIEVVGPLWPIEDGISQNMPLLSISLQKGQLRANINYQPQNLANLEVRHLPLDELELASLRGMIQRAELQLNFQRRRGHGLLSVHHPKFSGVLGEALDVVARWSGDVITLEKAVLEQASSRYELQGEYVLPGTRDRYSYKERDRLLKNALDGNLGSIISSMGRWRIRLEVPGAEVSEMLPLARLLSRSIDPSVHSRSKDIFIANLQSMGFHAGSLRELLEAIQSRNNWSDEVSMEEIPLPGLAELRGRWRGSLDASGGGDGDTLAEFDFHGEDWEWGSYITQRILAVGAYSNNNGLRLDNMFIQKDNATLHADGTVLGPISNLHFAVLNFPIGFLPKVAQILESSSESLNSLWQLLTPMKGILHMEGDLRGSLAKPECDVQVRLLDGAIGGIDLGRAEVVASITSTSRFLFNANFEPVIQSGHVHIQGSVPVKHIQDDGLENDDNSKDSDRTLITSGWSKENLRGPNEDSEKKVVRDRSEDGWDTQLTESLKDLNWDVLDDGEVKIDADIKDGGMMLLTAMYPYANWLHGYADVNLQVRGTVEQPVFDGSASFHRASVSSPLLQRPFTNFGGTIHVKANRLYIISMESRVSRKGKLAIKGSLPLKTTESSSGDKIDMKCEVLEVQAKNIFSGQVDSHVQIAGSILQPNISGRIKLSHGEAYLPHDKGNGDAINRLASRKPSFPSSGFGRLASSGHVSRFFGSQPPPPNKLPKHSAKRDEAEEAIDPVNSKPRLDIRLTDLRFFLGPELRIVYPLILNFAVSGGLELNGIAHPKLIRPKGVLTFENGDINLVATQVRLKRDHVNVAKFEPDVGLDPTLDLALVGSEWQFRIQSPASKWQDNLVVTSTRSVDQDVLSPSEAAKVFESQLAESLLERDGQLAFKKLATATLETLMPKIEGKGEFGQARWRLVYAPQIPSLLSVDPTIDPLKSLANNISFGTEVEVQLGKRLQASVVRQMKDSEMAVQWTLVYQLTSRLRVLFQSAPATRLLFEYSATSQD